MISEVFIPAHGRRSAPGLIYRASRGLVVVLSLCAGLSAQTNTYPWPASGNVGIGTTSPSSLLHVYSAATDAILNIQTGNLPHYQAGLFLSSNKNWLISSQGDWMYTNGALLFRNNSDGINAMTITAPGNVGIGTTNPQHLLHVAGTIGAEEVIVSSTGADYVFQPGYRLRPLSEVNAFIQANHHLPDIPSEAEVKENGLSLGDMQAKLLAKVEELTLHMIEADERNKVLEKQNTDLQERIARLEAASGNSQKDEKRQLCSAKKTVIWRRLWRPTTAAKGGRTCEIHDHPTARLNGGVRSNGERQYRWKSARLGHGEADFWCMGDCQAFGVAARGEECGVWSGWHLSDFGARPRNLYVMCGGTGRSIPRPMPVERQPYRGYADCQPNRIGRNAEADGCIAADHSDTGSAERVKPIDDERPASRPEPRRLGPHGFLPRSRFGWSGPFRRCSERKRLRIPARRAVRHRPEPLCHQSRPANERFRRRRPPREHEPARLPASDGSFQPSELLVYRSGHAALRGDYLDTRFVDNSGGDLMPRWVDRGARTGRCGWTGGNLSSGRENRMGRTRLCLKAPDRAPVPGLEKLENDVGACNMDTKLLAKIEELTLRMGQQESGVMNSAARSPGWSRTQPGAIAEEWGRER